MNMISAITKKNDWKIKIVDDKISKKWKKEFLAQGADINIVDKVFQLLIMSIDEKTYDGDNNYPWILNLTVNPDDIGLDCKDCKCRNCDCEPYYTDAEDDYSDEKVSEEYKKRKTIECTCYTVLNLNKLKQKYLEKFIVTDNKFVNAKLRREFIKATSAFAKSKEKDYHPGSSDTMVDILHPSLYCYVDGITEIHCTEELEKPSLFQWIPCNYSLQEKKFISQIHGLNQEDFPELHNSIESIFTNFLPGFQNVFNGLYNNKRTDELISLNNFENLQVIVKIGSTELTPGKSASSPSNWHLEGIESEKIIATGIYYYDMQNITDSYLSFRTVIDEYEINYPQNHDDYVKAHYGLEQIPDRRPYYGNNTDSTMSLGKIHTKKNMCLIFPNFLQHRVDDFMLVDKTKSGHRDILVFFLIDPRKKIISTENILSNEMSPEDAQIYRDLLMFHRKYTVKDQQNFFERGWSLCEH